MVSSSYDDADDDAGVPSLLAERSHIRKHFDVEDISKEYKGKVVSRKSLQPFAADESEEEEEDGEEEEADEDAEEEEGEDDEQMEEQEEADEDAEDAEMDGDDEEEQGDDDEEQDGSDAEGAKGMLGPLTAHYNAKRTLDRIA
jgi:hypothetical protein